MTVQQQVVTLQVLQSSDVLCKTCKAHMHTHHAVTACCLCKWLSLPVAARVHLYLQDVMVHVCAAKQPRSLTGARLGVGACLWDGAFVLTAYIAAQPVDTYAGEFLGNACFVFVICCVSQASDHSDTACALVLIMMLHLVVVSMFAQHSIV